MTEQQWYARVIADSIAPNGVRIVSVEARYPRIIHAEMLTHRMFARNASSSRARPFKDMVREVMESPYVPEVFTAEKRGMQGGEPIADQILSSSCWNRAMGYAVGQAESLHHRGVHKSICNRLLEPFGWITTLITGTHWQHFFNLRDHEDAEPAMQKTARLIREAIEGSVPRETPVGGWHAPYAPRLRDGQWPAEWVSTEAICRAAAARCARVSYRAYDGSTSIEADLALAEKLLEGSGGYGHWSPFEHVATPLSTRERSGCYAGWKSYRATFAKEFTDEWGEVGA